MFGYVGVLLISGYLIYKNYNTNKRYSDEIYQNSLKKIKGFESYIASINDYITWVKKDEIRTEYSDVINFFKNKSNYYKNEKAVKNFNELIKRFDSFITQQNQNYVKNQIQVLSSYFDEIEGKKLDEQQRIAVVTDEYSNLIIAGAGSGKTLTIIGKVKYLIEKKNILQHNILLLSFTKKTVEELNERLTNLNLGVEATTFHKLGFDTIKKEVKEKLNVTNDNTLGLVIKDFLKNEIYNSPEVLKAYLDYIALYMNIPEENEGYNSFGEKIENEKGIDFQTIKSKCSDLNKVGNKPLDSFQGERVRSVEELIIANFLFLNGIEYGYEKSYPYGEENYRPDFYLKEYDIYLEHFGVDKNNRAKWLTPFNEKKYVLEMELKREKHKCYNTKLIETYSYYNSDNQLLIKLEQMLKEHNVVFKPIDSSKVYSLILNNDQNFGNELNKLIETFINLYKSRNLSYDDILRIINDGKSVRSKFMLKRQKMFFQFVLPIIEKYDDTLKSKNEIDFNDMINYAAKAIKINKPNYQYDYIIIDEYQDISYSRYNLIQEIRNISKARLICVGDDWQSIYRFAGSDISLFSNFEKHIGYHEKLLIEQTYRNSQSLINITSSFIQKNNLQLSKKPKSKKENITDPINLKYFNPGNFVDVFINQISYFKKKYGNKSILVLGRHSFDIDELLVKNITYKVKYIERTGQIIVQGFEDIDIKFLTVHKSKGTEAENVIILNVKNHLLGFPNKMTDDPILSLLLNDSEDFRFAEERRLFYVALTRTKNEVTLMIPKESSVFVEELIKDNNYLISSESGNLSTTSCPYCKTGKLIIRENIQNNNHFLGCSNYPICNQTFNDTNILNTKILCNKCQSGFMVNRNGKHGPFLGCTCYPKCRNTIELIED
jgi:DNA helicase-4